MMTRREKLLVRPWQLRRYNNHKKKVMNAVPIIDFGPPPQRRHVTVKLKKLQKERERQMKIEDDNFTLLQHLGAIMRSKRVDNYWETKPPNFLRRVSIKHRTRSPTPCEEVSENSTPDVSTNRKGRCLACTPHREETIILPEERIPWEPPKKILTRRQSNSAVVPVISDFDFLPVKSVQCKEKSEIRKFESQNRTEKPVKMNYKKKGNKNSELPAISSKSLVKVEETEQRIVVRQGPLQISVNFPSFAEVKLIHGKSERYLQRNFCECKSFQALK